jgi:hypothetical protein
MQITQDNLERHGWLFSPSLRVVVREHEAGNGKWDVELDSYQNVGSVASPEWEPCEDWSDSAATLAELTTQNPELLNVADWIDGDKVNFH